MAVPPMIGVPDSGAYVFYSGSPELFAARRDALALPAATKYVGEDPGSAALHDAALLIEWLTAMAPYADRVAEHLETGDYTLGVTSNLAMMVEADATLLRTAEERGVSPELLTPFMTLMERRLADGHADEGITGVIDLLLQK